MRGIVVLSCTLALTCAAPAASGEGAIPLEGKWHATTSAGLPLAFEVSGGQLLNARYRFRWGFCGSFESAVKGSAPIEPNGHWRYADSRGPFVEGTFAAPDRAEGTVVAPSRQLPGCPETKATFVATPGEAPFEQAEAVVLDNARTRHFSAKPRTMILTRDGHLRLYALQWQDFGEPVARATGRAFLRRGCSRCRDREITRPRVSNYPQRAHPARGLQGLSPPPLRDPRPGAPWLYLQRLALPRITPRAELTAPRRRISLTSLGSSDPAAQGTAGGRCTR